MRLLIRFKVCKRSVERRPSRQAHQQHTVADEPGRITRGSRAAACQLAQIEVGVGVVGGILNGWSAYMAVQLVELLGTNLSSLFESMAVQDAALVKLTGIEMGGLPSDG